MSRSDSVINIGSIYEDSDEEKKETKTDVSKITTNEPAFNELKNENQKLIQSIGRYKEMIEKQKQTIRKLEIDLGEKAIKKSQEEIDLEKKYGMAMGKLSTMSDELVKANSEIITLKKLNQELKGATSTATNSLQEENQSLKQEVKRVNQTIQSLNANNRSLKNQIEHLNEQLREARAQTTQQSSILNEKITMLGQQIADLRAKKEKEVLKNQQQSRHFENLKSLNESNEKQIKKLKKQIELLSLKNSEESKLHLKAIKDYEEKEKIFEQQITKINESHQKEIKFYKEQEANVKTGSQQNSHLMAQIQNLNFTISSKDNELKYSREREISLFEEKKAYEERVNELEKRVSDYEAKEREEEQKQEEDKYLREHPSFYDQSSISSNLTSPNLSAILEPQNENTPAKGRENIESVMEQPPARNQQSEKPKKYQFSLSKISQIVLFYLKNLKSRQAKFYAFCNLRAQMEAVLV